jgi:hypothetical protein
MGALTAVCDAMTHEEAVGMVCQLPVRVHTGTATGPSWPAAPPWCTCEPGVVIDLGHDLVLGAADVHRLPHLAPLAHPAPSAADTDGPERSGQHVGKLVIRTECRQ